MMESPTIKLALKGYSKLNLSVADSRLPITLLLLEQIVNAFSSTISSDCHRRLMKAMCAIAFFAALRVRKRFVVVSPLRMLFNRTKFPSWHPLTVRAVPLN